VMIVLFELQRFLIVWVSRLEMLSEATFRRRFLCPAIGRKIAGGTPALRVHACQAGEQMHSLDFVVLCFQSFDTGARWRRAVLRSSLLYNFSAF
jgi:hypothetical protein